jgi:putative addiction module killer protein
VFGNPGDVQALGGALFEMRISYGPGYRVYFTEKSGNIVILLAGGDKRTQSADIRRARVNLKTLKL